MPRQYFQSESGLNYNYHRDYDPLAASYIESDPIGVRVNSYSTYAYASGNPVRRRDPYGLADNPADVWPLVQNGPAFGTSCPLGRCQGSDVLSFHYDNSSCGYDVTCQLAMQSAGFLPHTASYS